MGLSDELLTGFSAAILAAGDIRQVQGEGAELFAPDWKELDCCLPVHIHLLSEEGGFGALPFNWIEGFF